MRSHVPIEQKSQAWRDDRKLLVQPSWSCYVSVVGEKTYLLDLMY